MEQLFYTDPIQISELNTNHSFKNMLESIGFISIESLCVTRVPSNQTIINMLVFDIRSNVLLEINCLNNEFCRHAIKEILNVMYNFGDFLVMDDINDICMKSGITPILYNTWESIINRIEAA